MQEERRKLRFRNRLRKSRNSFDKDSSPELSPTVSFQQRETDQKNLAHTPRAAKPPGLTVPRLDLKSLPLVGILKSPQTSLKIDVNPPDTSDFDSLAQLVSSDESDLDYPAQCLTPVDDTPRESLQICLEKLRQNEVFTEIRLPGPKMPDSPVPKSKSGPVFKTSSRRGLRPYAQREQRNGIFFDPSSSRSPNESTITKTTSAKLKPSSSGRKLSQNSLMVPVEEKFLKRPFSASPPTLFGSRRCLPVANGKLSRQQSALVTDSELQSYRSYQTYQSLSLLERRAHSENDADAADPADSSEDAAAAVCATFSPGNAPQGLLTRMHLKLLYMISLYCIDDPSIGKERWVGKVPLLVLIYEGILAGAFPDFDFAPASQYVLSRRVYLNISQEGTDDIDDLLEMGYLLCLKLSSKGHRAVTAYRVSPCGEKLLASVSKEDLLSVQKDIDPLIHDPLGNLLMVQWREHEDAFYLVGKDSYSVRSTITDCEDVSYVSSPYLPSSILLNPSKLTSNACRVSGSGTNVRVSTSELIKLSGVKTLIGEYIPFGSNHLVQLNDKVGASERVSGGFFTSTMTHDQTSTQFDVDVGMTSVTILDFSMTRHMNFEAEIRFQEEEGIVQVEHFGVHVNEQGSILYGLKLESIMDKKDKLSLDSLARVLVDIHQDSSTIMEHLISPYQRELLDITYLGRASFRDKFNVILADEIEPKLTAAKYMDKEGYENELKQIVGDTLASHDLPGGLVVVIGRQGLLVTGPDIYKYERTITHYLGLMSLDIFIRNFFNRIFIFDDYLKEIEQMIIDHESDPNSIRKIREGVRNAVKTLLLLEEIHSYMDESLLSFSQEHDQNPLAIVLRKSCSPLEDLIRRVGDLKKKIASAHHELTGLRESLENITSLQMQTLYEALNNNTRNLEDMFRANERSSSSLEVMQVILSGTLAFELLDRLQFDNKWASVIQLIVQDNPSFWFLLNLSLWGVIAYFLMLLMRWLTDRSAGVLTVRLKANCKVNIPNLMLFLSTRPVAEEDSEVDGTLEVKKLSWQETDEAKWKGSPPKIELQFDQRHGYLLKVCWTMDKRNAGLRESDLREIFFSDLRKAGVL